MFILFIDKELYSNCWWCLSDFLEKIWLCWLSAESAAGVVTWESCSWHQWHWLIISPMYCDQQLLQQSPAWWSVFCSWNLFLTRSYLMPPDMINQIKWSFLSKICYAKIKCWFSPRSFRRFIFEYWVHIKGFKRTVAKPRINVSGRLEKSSWSWVYYGTWYSDNTVI